MTNKNLEGRVSMERKKAIALQDSIVRVIGLAGYTLSADDTKAIAGIGEFYRKITHTKSGRSLKLRFAYGPDSRTIGSIALEGTTDDVKDFYNVHVFLDDLKGRTPELKDLRLELPFDGLAYQRHIREADELKKRREYAESPEVDYAIGTSEDF